MIGEKSQRAQVVKPLKLQLRTEIVFDSAQGDVVK